MYQNKESVKWEGLSPVFVRIICEGGGGGGGELAGHVSNFTHCYVLEQKILTKWKSYILSEPCCLI